MPVPLQPASHWIGDLRRFLGPDPAAVERCELCRAMLAPRHAHLLERTSRRLLCACPGCALLFCGPDQRYRRVPETAARLPALRLDDAAWTALGLPIDLAFFLRRDGSPRALYPGPAGAVESTLPLQTWAGIVAANPMLASLEDEVEALLVNRIAGACDCYRAPIDRCYELVGRLRAHWHGIAGGEEARAAVVAFFIELDAEAAPCLS